MVLKNGCITKQPSLPIIPNTATILDFITILEPL